MRKIYRITHTRVNVLGALVQSGVEVLAGSTLPGGHGAVHEALDELGAPGVGRVTLGAVTEPHTAGQASGARGAARVGLHTQVLGILTCRHITIFTILFKLIKCF